MALPKSYTLSYKSLGALLVDNRVVTQDQLNIHRTYNHRYYMDF